MRTGVQPRLPRADRDDDRPVEKVGGNQGGVLTGVQQDQVGRAHRRPVQPAQQPGLPASVLAAVAGGVGGEQQVVQHDRGAPEQPPGQPHVEVAEVADEHRVRAVPAPGPPPAPGQHPPAPGEPDRQHRQPPGLSQHRDPAGGVDAERDVDLDHLVAAGAEAVDEHAAPGVGADVVGAEREDLHRLPSRRGVPAGSHPIQRGIRCAFVVSRRQVPVRRVVRLALLLAAAGACLAAVVAERDQIAGSLGRLGPLSILLAAVLVVSASVLTMLSWRALLADLGSRLPLPAAARIFFLAQLGKYLPGSVWPLLAQVELGRDHHVPARRSATAAVVSLGVAVATGLAVAASTLPVSTPAVFRRYWWAFAAIPVLVAVLHPRVLNPVLARACRLAGRSVPERPLTPRGILPAAGWMLLAWLCYGLQAVVLVRDLGGTGPAAGPGAIGAFALAWVVGFLVVFAPAGAGVREAALVLALSPALPAAAALLVALVSRLLLTAADLVLAGLAIGVERRARSRAGGRYASAVSER